MVRTKTTINWAYYERNCAADCSVSCDVVPMASQDPSVATENSMSSDSAESPTSSHPPLGDIQAMLQFWMVKDEMRRKEREERYERWRREDEERERERQEQLDRERKERERQREEREGKRERERKEREAKEKRDREARERERQERKIKEERDRKEREAERQERFQREREKERRERERQKCEEEQEKDRRARLENLQLKEHFYLECLQWAKLRDEGRNRWVNEIEEATFAAAAARDEIESVIKAERSMVLEGASFDDMNDTETEAESSEMSSFHADSETNDSTWDGPQDELLVRDAAIVSTEPAVKESAESVCNEVFEDDGFTPVDSSQIICGNSSTSVGGKRSTPEPESPVVAYFENPSESEPIWIFQSPELGERAWNPDFKSQTCEARLCDELLVDSLPMIFSVKNRSVTVTKIGVVQFLGKHSMNFSVVQCSNPCSDFWCGFGVDSIRSVSSCSFSGGQRFSSVWSSHSSRRKKFGSVWPPSDDAGQSPRTVKSENLSRKSGNRYYPILTVQSLIVTCLNPRLYADAEFWKIPVSQSTQSSAEMKGAEQGLMFTPLIWKSNRYIALGANPGSLAMFPSYLPQPPGSQQVPIWTFKLEFGITEMGPKFSFFFSAKF